MPKIIEVMKEKGYSPDQYGMCYGLAAMGAQAVIRQEGDKFAQRIIAIKNINTTPEKANKLDLNAFFDGVSVYHASTGMPLDFFNALGIKDTQNIIDSSSIFRPLENECIDLKYAVPKMSHQFMSRFNKNKLIDLLKELRTKNPGSVFSLIISYGNHSVQIGFDNNKWLSVNHDEIDYDHDISKVINNILEAERVSSYGYWVADILVLSSDKHIELPCSDIICDLSNIQHIPLDEMSYFLHLALRKNHHKLIFKITQETFKYPLVNTEDLMARDENGMPGFYCAIELGHEKTIIEFINTLISLDLSIDENFYLLSAKTKQGSACLFSALMKGDCNTFTLFIRRLSSFSFSSAQIHELLAAKNERGNPGLSFSFESGNEKMICEFIDALFSFNLSSEQKYELLAAKDIFGVPGLSYAFEKGRHNVVSSFMTSLSPLDLSSKQLCELLSAKNSVGVPGLFYALNNNYAECVNAFIKGLDLLNLSVSDKIELLEAKIEDGEISYSFILNTKRAKMNKDAISALVCGLEKLKAEQQEHLFK